MIFEITKECSLQNLPVLVGMSDSLGPKWNFWSTFMLCCSYPEHLSSWQSRMSE